MVMQKAKNKRYFPWVLFVVYFTKIEAMEPRFPDYYHRDYKLLEKIARLEAQQNALEETVQKQDTDVKTLQGQLADMRADVWGTWSTWSTCTMNCTGDSSGRVQYRSRQYLNPEAGERSETESRPCNAVQFAGCEKTFGDDDNYGIVYDFADQIAMAACTAIKSGGRSYAVRRKCSSQAVSCDDLCASLSLTCFESLHVYYKRPSLPRKQTGTLGLQTHRYGGCSGQFCGPNFCCCT